MAGKHKEKNSTTYTSGEDFFLRWAKPENIEDIPADEQNILICPFLMEMKKNGAVYETTTPQSFQRSLQWYLNDMNSKINILKDWEFVKCGKLFFSKKKQLVFEEAKGNRPHTAKEVFDAEENLLFHSDEFGDENPEAL